jgi:hypothetical protein
MYSTHEAELDIPSLPHAARRVHIVPALKTTSLLSIGQLCDAGCEVLFDANCVRVRHANELILAGNRSPHTGLWHLGLNTQLSHTIPRPSTIPHSSLAAVAVTTPADLVAFAHATLFSPALSTLHSALQRGFLPDFQGLTAKTLSKYPPMSIPMVKGHLDQSRKNQRSTKPNNRLDLSVVTPLLDTTDEVDPTEHLTNFPDSNPNNERTHHCFAAVLEPAAGQIHTDQTGRFIVKNKT